MGLLAVIGPSRKDQRGLPRFFATSFSKIRSRSQKERRSRSRAGKSSVVGTSWNTALHLLQRKGNRIRQGSLEDTALLQAFNLLSMIGASCDDFASTAHPLSRSSKGRRTPHRVCIAA